MKIKSKLKINYIECDRAKRYQGKSKMNFVALVTHGFSSIAVFSDIVFVRLTIFSTVFLILSFIAIIVVLPMKFVFDAASPGWATSVISLLLILSTQFFFMVINFTIANLRGRGAGDALQMTEYKGYIREK